MTTPCPVYTYKVNPEQIGNGLYGMVACFVSLGVHVPYVFEAHSENEYLKSVGDPLACDGSCKHNPGIMNDFSTERHHTSYDVKEIVAKALAYKKPK